MLMKIENGVEVQMSDQEEADIKALWAENDAKSAKDEWKRKLELEMPSPEKSLEMLFEMGYDKWKQTIQSIKDKYPNISAEI